MNLALQTMDQN